MEDQRNVVELKGACFKWEEAEEEEETDKKKKEQEKESEKEEKESGKDEKEDKKGEDESSSTSSNQDSADSDKKKKKGDPFELKDLNLEVKEGSLVAVVGRVGSGKSTLLSSLLGESALVRGTASVRAGTK